MSFCDVSFLDSMVSAISFIYSREFTGPFVHDDVQLHDVSNPVSVVFNGFG